MIHQRTGIFQKTRLWNDLEILFPFLPIALLLFIMSACMSACAAPVPITAANEIREDLSLRTVLENPSGHKGETVVWGGIILRSEKRNEFIDLYVEETPFDFRGRPKDRELSEGVFIARTSDLPDSKAYAAGRKVTVAGDITGEELGTYMEAPYVYPVVRLREIHLWKMDSPPIRWNWGRIPYYWPDEYTPDQERRTMP